jgi:predicted nucleotidyltransferase
VRLTQQQINSIKTTAAEILGHDARVYLFGSRTDDARRGGDIDLLVIGLQTPADRWPMLKALFLARLKKQIGEQRIDVVFAPAPGEPELPIHRIARETGIPL